MTQVVVRAGRHASDVAKAKSVSPGVKMQRRRLSKRQIRKEGERGGRGDADKVMRVATSSATTYPRYYPRQSQPLIQIQFWYLRTSERASVREGTTTDTRCKTYKFALRWSQPEDTTRRLTRAKDARVHDVVRRRRALLTLRGRLMARGRRRM